jgi:phage-related protein
MAFYGNNFIYDNIPSETYGLIIMDIDANAINKSMGSSSMEILEQKIYRRATPYFFGSTPSPKLTFSFSAYSEQEMDAEHFALVQKWLFSSRTYKRFAIDQVDMQNIYFNCIMNNPEISRVGNLVKGFNCEVICDSPFAWLYPKITTYTYSSSIVNTTEIYYNGSDDTGGYLYPNLVLTQNNIAGEIIITNLSDNSRIFSFSDLQPNEVLTINNSNQTISSSTGLLRLSKFNKKFLRLVPGVNNLKIQGNVASIVMTNQWIAKKIGG